MLNAWKYDMHYILLIYLRFVKFKMNGSYNLGFFYNSHYIDNFLK